MQPCDAVPVPIISRGTTKGFSSAVSEAGPSAYRKLTFQCYHLGANSLLSARNWSHPDDGPRLRKRGSCWECCSCPLRVFTIPLSPYPRLRICSSTNLKSSGASTTRRTGGRLLILDAARLLADLGVTLSEAALFEWRRRVGFSVGAPSRTRTAYDAIAQAPRDDRVRIRVRNLLPKEKL